MQLDQESFMSLFLVLLISISSSFIRVVTVAIADADEAASLKSLWQFLRARGMKRPNHLIGSMGRTRLESSSRSNKMGLISSVNVRICSEAECVWSIELRHNLALFLRLWQHWEPYISVEACIRWS